MKKYELTEETLTVSEKTLFRIISVPELGFVKTGEFGGYIEKEENPDTKVENLTKEQLAQIYTGEITDWADECDFDTDRRYLVCGRYGCAG